MVQIEKNKELKKLNEVGIIFVGPIIGVPESLDKTFDHLRNEGATVITIDIFNVLKKKKGLLQILGLTLLPGSHKRRVSFANKYPEKKVFAEIFKIYKQLKEQGIDKIVLGGMSGGFIFASRLTQIPPDTEIDASTYSSMKEDIIGLIGISPIIYYPQEVKRKGADLKKIPENIKTQLFFGDSDTIVPEGTVNYAKKIATSKKNISTYIFMSDNFNQRGGIKHQYFGGDGYVGKLKNIFWHPEAEKENLKIIYHELTKHVEEIL